MDDAVNGGSGGHGVFEDLIPLRKDQIGSDDNTAAFITFRQEGKQDFHLFSGLLNVADIIEDQDFKTIQAAKFDFQFEVPASAQQSGLLPLLLGMLSR